VPARGLRVVQRHDAAWLRGVEDNVRGAEALRPGTGQGCVGEEAGRAGSRGVSAALTRRRAGRGS
jgi:hypothetical protein